MAPAHRYTASHDLGLQVRCHCQGTARCVIMGLRGGLQHTVCDRSDETIQHFSFLMKHCKALKRKPSFFEQCLKYNFILPTFTLVDLNNICENLILIIYKAFFLIFF